MQLQLKTRTSVVIGVLLPIIALVCVIIWRNAAGESKEAEHTGGKAAAHRGVPKAVLDSIELSPRAVKMGGIETARVTRPTRLRTLELRGSLAFDSNRLVNVSARFPGQIMEVATVDEPAVQSPGNPIPATNRPLSYTDHVTKGQRLAVLWSKNLGETKSELVDAEARLKLDEVTLSRLKTLVESGSIAERSVREAERAVDVGVIAAKKAERTLRSWAISDEEIERIKAEAELVHQRGKGEKRSDADWARVDVIAPMDGTLVEKNITVGDIVDTNAELFKIADLSVMSVWLHAYEEDLMYLRQLVRPIRAEIRLPANPDLGVLEGTIDRIGDIIDPNEHMALLIGSVKNEDGVLQAGQFVSATIQIRNEADVVEIPATALVDEDNDCYIFVQPDPNVPRFQCRKVLEVRRQHDVVYVRSHLTEEQRKKGLQELHTDELVVSRGALELREDLLQQKAAAGSAP
jgi:cobalt-zinc-cadmium efflux system membrane fusion protein